MDVTVPFLDARLDGRVALLYVVALLALAAALVADHRRRRAARARADRSRLTWERGTLVELRAQDDLTPVLAESARAVRALEAAVSTSLRSGRGCLPDRELAPGQATIVIGTDAQVQANVRARFARTGSVHVATEIAPGTWSVMRALAPKAQVSTPAEGAHV